jgi:hypothetical protein
VLVCHGGGRLTVVDGSDVVRLLPIAAFFAHQLGHTRGSGGRPQQGAAAGRGWLTPAEEARHLLRGAAPSLAFRFPDLTINLLRERCAACGDALTDEALRRGWSRSASDYTTAHVGCRGAPALPAAHAPLWPPHRHRPLRRRGGHVLRRRAGRLRRRARR